LSLTKPAMTSALVTSTTSLSFPFATSFIARVNSVFSSNSPKSSRRRIAIFVETEYFALVRERWSAPEGLRMACGASGCGDEVEKEKERPEKREDEMG
jgi:hypothetical protein